MVCCFNDLTKLQARCYSRFLLPQDATADVLLSKLDDCVPTGLGNKIAKMIWVKHKRVQKTSCRCVILSVPMKKEMLKTEYDMIYFKIAENGIGTHSTTTCVKYKEIRYLYKTKM